MNSDRLPSEWVDQLFKRLSVRYGRAFMARWDGVEIDDVKADWAQVLGGFRARPDCIAYGLDNLPADRPPTATQFRDLCRAKPDERQALRIAAGGSPMPKAVAEALGGLRFDQKRCGKGWARALQEKASNGARLGFAQRRLVREALREDSISKECDR